MNVHGVDRYRCAGAAGYPRVITACSTETGISDVSKIGIDLCDGEKFEEKMKPALSKARTGKLRFGAESSALAIICKRTQAWRLPGSETWAWRLDDAIYVL